MNRLLSVLLAIIAAPALAGTADVSWTNPTQNTDGSAIPATGQNALASTTVQWFQCTAKTDPWPASPSAATVPQPGLSYQITGLVGGLRYCVRAYVTNNAGVASDPTTTVDKLMPAPKPNPPTLTVAALTAYYVIQQTDKFVLLPAGTVPSGTSCNTSQSVNGYYGVPRNSVTWFGTVKPLVVVAQCG